LRIHVVANRGQLLRNFNLAPSRDYHRSPHVNDVPRHPWPVSWDSAMVSEGAKSGQILCGR
jgi:hypothetical protein